MTPDQLGSVIGATFGLVFVVVSTDLLPCEVALLLRALAALNGPLGAPQAAVAWTSVVVGAHFLALAAVWRQRLFVVLGGALVLSGAADCAQAAGGASAATIDTAGGVLPGIVLLGFALHGSTTGTARTASPAT